MGNNTQHLQKVNSSCSRRGEDVCINKVFSNKDWIGCLLKAFLQPVAEWQTHSGGKDKILEFLCNRNVWPYLCYIWCCQFGECTSDTGLLMAWKHRWFTLNQKRESFFLQNSSLFLNGMELLLTLLQGWKWEHKCRVPDALDNSMLCFLKKNTMELWQTLVTKNEGKEKKILRNKVFAFKKQMVSETLCQPTQFIPSAHCLLFQFYFYI